MKPEKRVYTLRARAGQEAATRLRIVEAIVALHEEVGPSRTTIADIARRAGVQRLTVYRHFPSEEGMLQACSALFMERNPAPAPSQWLELDDPQVRTLAALADVYRYFSSTAPMFEKIVRDAATMEAVARQFGEFEQWLDETADVLLAGRRLRGKKKTLTRQTIRHVIDFTTWQSLDRQGIADDQKVELATAWISAPAT